MLGDDDLRDKITSRKLLLLIILLLSVLAVAFLWIVPSVFEVLSATMAPGLGLKEAAAISFLVTLVIMIVFAIAAGDGLLGELQFMLIGFFFFFLIVWLLLAWIF